MGKKKKIIKSIESFEKRIKEHEEKIGDYKKINGKDYSLIEYWEDEIERLRKQKAEEEEKLGG